MRNDAQLWVSVLGMALRGGGYSGRKGIKDEAERVA